MIIKVEFLSKCFKVSFVLLQTTIHKDQCCSEVTECVCDESLCPVYKQPECDSSLGFKTVVTATPWAPYELPSCCETTYETVCVCDV